jgi:hypothetical protein
MHTDDYDDLSIGCHIGMYSQILRKAQAKLLSGCQGSVRTLTENRVPTSYQNPLVPITAFSWKLPYYSEGQIHRLTIATIASLRFHGLCDEDHG